MTTYTTYVDGTTVKSESGHNAAGSPARTVIVGTYDAGRRNGAAADVIEVLAIPANTFVEQVHYEVLTGEASQTMSVGDGSGTSSWVAAADVATTGNSGVSSLALTTGTPNTVTGYSSGKLYTAADTIDILVPSGKAYTTLKVRLSAVVTLFQ